MNYFHLNMLPFIVQIDVEILFHFVLSSDSSPQMSYKAIEQLAEIKKRCLVSPGAISHFLRIEEEAGLHIHIGQIGVLN